MSRIHSGWMFRAVGVGVCAMALVAASAGRAGAQQAAGSAAQVTFAKDVAPILQKNCQQCHQPGAIGPMSLTTFEEVRPWARAIKQKVVAGEMPPYRYDRDVGIQNLKYDLRLSEAEIADDRALGRQRVRRWAIRADLPPPVTFPDPNEWAFADEFGPPDLIVQTKPFTLPASGQDVWWRPVVPTGLTEDRCIKAVSVKPSVQGARRRASRQQRADRLRREDRVSTSRPSGSPSTRSARSARSCRRTPAGRFRPTRWSGGTCTTIRPARSSSRRRDRDGRLALPGGPPGRSTSRISSSTRC